MGQQQGKERSSAGGSAGGLVAGHQGGAPGSSSIVSAAGGSTVDRHVGSSIRNKATKPRAATVSAASTASGKERGILAGSNIFTEHNGKARPGVEKTKRRKTVGE